MTNVTTLMALAVICLVSSLGFASAEIRHDGTSEVHVYINNTDDFPFDITVVEGGDVIIFNESQREIDIQHTGTVGSDRSGTFSSLISPYGGVAHFNFPVENCSSCYFAGTYYFKDSIGGEMGSITIIHPEGWIPPVQEEVGITENVVVVLGTNSTSIAPEPTPIEPEGKYNVATWTGTYDMVLLQEQLAEVSAKFNKAVENLGYEKNKVKDLENQVKQANGYADEFAEDVRQLDKLLATSNEEIRNLETKLLNTPDNTQQIANMNGSIITLENKVIKLEQEKAELTIEKEKWKTLSDNWYAVAVEQLRVMVNVLGL